MATAIVDRPQGHIINLASATQASGLDGGAGSVLMFDLNHGLNTGDFIYITSSYESYNGFWYVDIADIHYFSIRPYATGDKQAFIAQAVVTYYFCGQTHNWSCVHLPIVYRLSSDYYPTNSADTARTVSSLANNNGYCHLTLSGDIKSTGSASELDFVKVTGSNAGIYQIINYVSDTVFTIDLPYSAGVSFASSTVQYYYKDYYITVDIYAGIYDTHVWAGQKPYELITTIKAVPNADNIVTINVADYVKSKIDVFSNNPILDTLPNDINSFCSFYIVFNDYYSGSLNGYTIGNIEITGSTSDKSTFEGFAANAMLPFKNINSGLLSDYVMTYGTARTTQKFLTNMTEPVIFLNQYFDISFIINSTVGGFYVLEQYLNENRVVQTSVATVLTNQDQGIYRFEPTWDSAYSYIRLSVYDFENRQISETLDIKIDNECVDNYTDIVWKNNLGGHDYWRFGAGSQLTINKRSSEEEKNIFTNWPKSYGEFADTIKRTSSLEGNKSYLLRSQFVTNQQAEDIITGVESSILVQVQVDQKNRRTVKITGSNTLEETEKLKELIFKIEYTDNFAVQKP